MGSLHRAQLLLESEQHEALAEIAQREGRSISDLVREIVRQYLIERDEETRRLREIEAIEGLAQIREMLPQVHGIYEGDLLAEARASTSL